MCKRNPDVHWTFHQVTVNVPFSVATLPPGGWLGSSADEGRAKLRKAVGTRTEGKNYGSPNRNPLAIALRNGERRELKHLSTGRKRKQSAMSLVTASKRDTVQTEALTGNVVFGLTLTARPSV